MANRGMTVTSIDQDAVHPTRGRRSKIKTHLLLGISWGMTALLLGLTGCSSLHLSKLFEPKAKFVNETGDEDEFRTDQQLDDYRPPMIGDHTIVTGTNLVTLEGVGLVTGLPNTGGDQAPGYERTALLDDMRRRKIPNPNGILQSPTTALVVVRAYQPVLAQPGDRFDVEVRLPDGSSATSLNGGWLLECDLAEKMVVEGAPRPLEGNIVARASGPILVGIENSKASNGLVSGNTGRGKVVGGAISKTSRDLSLFLNSDFRSVRNSRRIATRIGERFFDYDQYGHRVPLADPKTDVKIVLNIHKSYKEDFPRYWQVIQNISFKESEVEKRVRMERLRDELSNPDKAEDACLQLEAVGKEAVPILYEGLKAPTLECRYYAAVSLAYLGDMKGLEVLYEAARDVPAFRIYALLAMAVSKDAEAMIYLRRLLDEPSIETRYGAFRAMTFIDDNDPYIRGEMMNDQFMLHVLNTQGDPLIHLSTNQKAEVVLYGSGQQLQTPIAIRAGRDILVSAGPQQQTITVSRHRIGEPSETRKVTTQLDDVLRAVIELGASFPDVAQMLAEADRQKNLEGRIAIDQLPEPGRVYERPAMVGNVEFNDVHDKRVIGHSHLVPNIFFNGVKSEDALKPEMSVELLKSLNNNDPKPPEQKAPEAEKSFLPVFGKKADSDEQPATLDQPRTTTHSGWETTRAVIMGTPEPILNKPSSDVPDTPEP